MLTPINDALEKFLADASHQRSILDALPSSEKNLPITQACDHILREAITSPINVPPCANSAMDGIVVHEQLMQKPVEALAHIEISQRITAGDTPSTLKQNTCARIFTGATIPAQGVCVVMQEACTFHDDGTVSIHPDTYPLKPQQNIRPQGQDIQQGECLFNMGHKLRPQDIGLLASIGISHIKVRTPLRIAVVNTGNELQMPGEPLEAGKIYNSNGFMLQSLLENMGCHVVQTPIMNDKPEKITAQLQALTHFDCIITTGGVSVGEEDHMKAAIEAVGTLNHWKLAIKPGKPLAFGHIDHTPIWGLPGNPVSAFVTFLAVVKPYLRALIGDMTPLPLRRVQSAFSKDKTSPRQEFLRVTINPNNEAVPFSNQSSGVLSSVTQCDGLAIIPANQPVHVGQALDIMHFNDWV